MANNKSNAKRTGVYGQAGKYGGEEGRVRLRLRVRVRERVRAMMAEAWPARRSTTSAAGSVRT